MNVAVFSGSLPGNEAAYLGCAQELGEHLAQAGHRIIFGGNRLGLMGAMASSALAAGGQVIGIVPKNFPDRDFAHEGLSQLLVVEDFAQRKAKMLELCDAALVAPGGLGTLDEACEFMSLGSAGLHNKAIGFFNYAGFYEPLRALLQKMHLAGFMRPNYDQERVFFASDLPTLLAVISFKDG